MKFSTVGFHENIFGWNSSNFGKKFNFSTLLDVVQTLLFPLTLSLPAFFWKYFNTSYILTE